MSPLEKAIEVLNKQEFGTHILCDIWFYELRSDGLWWEIDIEESSSARDLAKRLLAEARNGNPWSMY